MRRVMLTVIVLCMVMSAAWAAELQPAQRKVNPAPRLEQAVDCEPGAVRLALRMEDEPAAERDLDAQGEVQEQFRRRLGLYPKLRLLASGRQAVPAEAAAAQSLGRRA